MSRRGENIFKRKDGRWEARYIHHYENGKAKYRYLYAKTYNEVKVKRNIEISSPDKTKKISLNGKITLGDLSLLWLSDIRPTVKEATYARYYRSVIKYIIPAIGYTDLSLVDSHYVNRYSEVLLREGGMTGLPLSPKTVSDILCIIKSIIKFGKINGYPCRGLEGVRFPQKSTHEIKVFGEQEREKLENILLSSEDTTSLGIVFSVFLGLRIGEVCGLMWGDIDFNNYTVKISRTIERIANTSSENDKKTKVIISEPKTDNSMRTIPIPNFLNEYIIDHKKENDIYLITGTRNYIEPHSFYIRYKKYLSEHGLSDHTFHSLRHTFATRCVEKGFDIKSLSEILGHSSVTTTMNFYIHPSVESKRSQMELLAP